MKTVEHVNLEGIIRMGLVHGELEFMGFIDRGLSRVFTSFSKSIQILVDRDTGFPMKDHGILVARFHAFRNAVVVGWGAVTRVGRIEIRRHVS